MKVKQLKNGIQERPYADHIYLWEITTENNETEAEILEFATSLKKAYRKEEQYLKDYRETTNFEKKMHIICGGYYTLKKVSSNLYEYTVVYPYVD